VLLLLCVDAAAVCVLLSLSLLIVVRGGVAICGVGVVARCVL